MIEFFKLRFYLKCLCMCVCITSFNSCSYFVTNMFTLIETEYLKQPTPDSNRAKEELEKMLRKMDSSKESDHQSSNIEMYSPWLKKFSPESCGRLEIPGQYTGECRPNPQYHTTVSKFKEKVSK